ncbi:MAG: hypothetical protein COT55_02910, partial [Candidatus Diapherotrites archaeon CG09_land_8_20_14_0_10_32_12]
MLFVANKELLNNTLDKLFNFYPDKNGPYSKTFQPCLNSLSQKGLVSELIKQTEMGNAYEYKLTTEGIEKANTPCDKLDSDLKKKLS